MAKKTVNPVDKLKAADKKHNQNTEQYVKIVSTLYNKAIEDLSALALMIKDFGDDEDFSFDKNPGIAKKAEEVVLKLSERISAIVDRGSRSEWLGACAKSTQFIEDVLNVSKLTKQTLQKYNDRNLEALAAFQDRKVEGMNLSERVWKMVAPMKDEVELAVDTSNKYYKNGINSSKSLTKMDRAIGQGTSAAELSRDVRSCLLEPNKLFRRVRDKHGNLTLSKAAKLYHPGQGVYRSSYKNAMRMTRTEINMAYRQSDHMRWQQLDFVVGIKVQTSNNHTVLDPKSKGRLEMHDLCDKLAGSYPKEFKFVGWHPQCRCFATPILKTLEEVDKDVDANGNYNNLPSANQVYDVPQNFKDYVADNEERMNGWKSTPYYLKDNPQYVDEALHPEKYIKKPLVLDQDTFKRLSDFEMYGFNHQRSTLFNESLVKAKLAQLEGDLDAFEAAMADMQFRMEKNEASTASKAKNKKTAEQIRAEKIQAAHDKRAAERTEERIQEINEFIKKHEKRTVEVMDNLRADINKASMYRDIDVRQATDVLTGSVGVETSKGVASYSLERMQKESEMLNMRMAELVDEAKKLTDLIPDAVDQLKFYTIEELKDNHTIIKDQYDYVDGMPIEDRLSWVESLVKNSPNKIQKEAYNKKLEEVKLQLRIEELKKRLKDLGDIAGKTNVSLYNELYAKAGKSLKDKNPDDAESYIERLESIKPTVLRYDVLYDYEYSKKGKGSGKIRDCLTDVVAFLDVFNIANANKRLAEGEAIKDYNEASNAAKKAAAERKKQQEAQKEPEEPEEPEMTLADARSLDDVKKIYGDKLPKTLQELDMAINDFTNVSSDLINNRDEIEKKVFELFENSDYGMAIKHGLLESVLKKGFLNTFQTGTSQGYNGSRKTTGEIEHNHQRLPASHTMFNPSNKKYVHVVRCERVYDGPQFERGEYEKYGHLLVRDKVESMTKQGVFYGDVQIRFKKSKVCPTFTYNDSLCLRYQPSLCCDPKVESFDRALNTDRNNTIEDEDYGSIIKMRDRGHSSYMELQYHGDLGIDCIDSITFPSNPIKNGLCDEKVLNGFANNGAKIFYIEKGKAIQMTFESKEEMRARILKAAEERHKKRDADFKKKGFSPDEEISRLIEEREKEKTAARNEAEKFLVSIASYENKDISRDKLERLLAKGDYFGARLEVAEIKKNIKYFESREKALVDLIPDVKDLHKRFTMDELEGAYAAIKSKISFLENKSKSKGENEEGLMNRFLFEVSWIEDPSHRSHSTWEIARDAYKRKAEDLAITIKIQARRNDIESLRKLTGRKKEFYDLLDEAEILLNDRKPDEAEVKINAAFALKETEEPTTKKKVVYEGVVFGEECFTEERKNAAKLIHGRSAQDGFNKADKKMSRYTEDVWSKLTDEEKLVAYMYTQGSKYMNEPFYGEYRKTRYTPPRLPGRFSKYSDMVRDCEDDINTMTKVIDKAKALEEDITVQHSEDVYTFMSRFGIDLRYDDISKCVGKVGSNDSFMSTSCAEKSLFVAKPPKERCLDVVMNIYLPKGTKGMYTEPFAHWGDGKKPYGLEKDRYGTDALEWDGKSRLDSGSNAGDQVEFVIQRGSKFRITKAEKIDGKWYIDCELIEQEKLKEFKYKHKKR